MEMMVYPLNTLKINFVVSMKKEFFTENKERSLGESELGWIFYACVRSNTYLNGHPLVMTKVPPHLQREEASQRQATEE